MREQFSFFTLRPWTPIELRSLLDAIRHSGLAVPETYEELLIKEAEGSPRFIKGFFRIFKARKNGTNRVDLDLIIQETRGTLS
jgi:hypothetical protein